MRTILILIAAILIGACTPASRDATLAASHLVALQDQYQHAAAIYERHIDTVPEPRRAEVQRAWAVVELLHDRLQTGDLPAIAEALALYEIARPAWRELRAEAVAMIEAGQIADPLERMRLIEIDRRAQRLDEAVQRLSVQGADGMSLAGIVADLAPLVALVARMAI
ncbi:hypothetical protein [Pseudazoarcus pumilus]|uniref:Uncharacterized protein n=1 Tax=Pseudazoarcus pumilus TaxID=2067960 RepID=A0A2I6S808_9RHOO|nr:hypothetical protein [Pseudazoarcus pumilus]AUN95394.1 hypothetical protein C0099_10930 [Pseudazoarcus pumilus]